MFASWPGVQVTSRSSQAHLFAFLVQECLTIELGNDFVISTDLKGGTAL